MKMNAKIMSLTIILLLIIGSFGAVGNSNEKLTENDCDCENTEEIQQSFKERSLGLIKPEGWPANARIKNIQPIKSLPSSFDWREEANGLPPARDQGSCGSCWAFGTIAPLECNIKIKDGEIVDLSEQELTSCTWFGCNNGGFFAYDYLMVNGIAMEDDFVYTADDEAPCGTDGPYNRVYKVDDYAQIVDGIPTDEQMKQAIYDYGPIGVCVYTDTVAWIWHSTFIPNEIYDKDSDEDTNHIVTLVGWNDDPGYWIMRNSWGTGFCNQGYMKFKYGICSIGEYAHYVVYEGCDLEKKTKDGDTFYDSGGDVKIDRNKAILSEGENPGWVSYKIKPDNPNNNDVEELWVGFQYKDESIWGNGPNFYVIDWEEWITLETGMGQYDTYYWTWRKFTDVDGLIDDKGYVHIKMAAQADDDTWIRRAAIKFKLKVVAKPDLDCDGYIVTKGAVKPGSKVTGDFTVTNVGEAGSLLDWEVDSWPDWGSDWSFTPLSGQDLEKGNEITVEVSFYAPDIEFWSDSGDIKVVNKENNDDFDTVPVAVTTQRNRALFYRFLDVFQNRYPLIHFFFKSLIFSIE
jgi:C1A family cysteine protease